MSDHEKNLKIFVEKWTTGANDLVAPEHRIDVQLAAKWIKEFMVNPTRISDWDGNFLLNGFEADTAKHAYHKFVAKKGDILIGSYAKTGTTWVNEIVRHILYQKDNELLTKVKRISQFYSFIEMGPVEKYSVIDNLQLPRRILSTHLPASLINWEKQQENNTKILYMIRNPKDQAVSWYHFALTMPCAKKDPWNKLYPENEREFYDLFLSGQQKVFAKEGEGYLEHIKGWCDHQNDSNVMFLFYEELHKDIRCEVRKIAKFLDVELTDEEVEQVVKRTSFKTMKQDDTAVLKFTRKGVVGGWKNHLTVAQSELIDANVEQILGDSDIKFTYAL